MNVRRKIKVYAYHVTGPRYIKNDQFTGRYQMVKTEYNDQLYVEVITGYKRPFSNLFRKTPVYTWISEHDFSFIEEETFNCKE